MADKIIRATGEIAELRFVLIDATVAANSIGDFHQAHAFARILMGETMVSSLLLASGLKANGTAQVKFQFSGDVSRVMADATPLGLVRAMIPREELIKIGDFEPLLSAQLMRVRKLNENGALLSEGIVEMPSEKIGPSTACFLLQSEQTKSAVGILAQANPAGTALDFCGGFLLEAFPKADEKTLAIMEQVIRDLPSIAHYHRTEPGLDLEAMLQDLAGPFLYVIHREMEVKAYCPCSEAGMMQALTGLPKPELEEICQKQETLELHCEYCRKSYSATPGLIQSILSNLSQKPR